MRIVEIKPLSNGAHRNQSNNLDKIPNGWAVVPNDLEVENFPFGDLKAERINGIMTVTKWIAGIKPESEQKYTPTDSERISALEAAVEMLCMPDISEV